jgi:hypothetical protein
MTKCHGNSIGLAMREKKLHASVAKSSPSYNFYWYMPLVPMKHGWHHGQAYFTSSQRERRFLEDVRLGCNKILLV